LQVTAHRRTFDEITAGGASNQPPARVTSGGPGGTAAGTLLILLFLPALHAAWFRINPTADEAHSPSQGVARLSELIAAPAE